MRVLAIVSFVVMIIGLLGFILIIAFQPWPACPEYSDTNIECAPSGRMLVLQCVCMGVALLGFIGCITARIRSGKHT